MNIIYALLITIHLSASCTNDVITPYKFSEEEANQMQKKGLSSLKISEYQIPQSCRFTASRNNQDAPNIVYYMSKPNKDVYPIVFLCGGSTDRESLGSIIHFHRYFLQECLDIGAAVITVELWGIDGATINEQECMNNYTRSQRFQDHITVIEVLKKNPPQGWNGKLIFIGVSEGGPLVTSLTTHYDNDTLATVNWCGACDYSWKEQMWAFIEHMKKTLPWHIKWPLRLRMMLPRWAPFAIDFPKNKSEYNKRMDSILLEPSCDAYFLNMTHKYHADAMLYPKPSYEKIKTPYLVVSGSQDSIIEESDTFVQKAREAGVNITYMRVADMDHYIRRRPDIISQSFAWIEEQIFKSCMK